MYAKCGEIKVKGKVANKTKTKARKTMEMLQISPFVLGVIVGALIMAIFVLATQRSRW